MSRAVIIHLPGARSRVVPTASPRGVVTGIVNPSGVPVTFHILTELGVVIDTELADQMRTE